MKHTSSLRLLVTPFMLLATSACLAATANVVHISVSRSRSLTARHLVADVTFSARSPHGIKAQDEVARDVSAALRTLPRSVRANTSGYSIFSGTDKKNGKTHRYQAVRETLSIEGGDAGTVLKAATAMTGKHALVSALHYTVPKGRMAAARRAVSKQALAAWRHRVGDALLALGCRRASYLNISVNDAGASRPRPVVMMEARRAPAVSAPAGTSAVTVTVSGTAQGLGCGAHRLTGQEGR